MQRLRRLMDDDPLAATTQVDKFGMTPLHILSLSQTPNVDMLLAVMNEGNMDHMVHSRDLFGSTPMDYLCWNRMPTCTEVIRRVLQTRFDYWLGLLDRSLISDPLRQAVDDALAVVDWSARKIEIGKVYSKLVNYYERRMKIRWLVELCLWKIKIAEVSANQQTVDRESCRIHSGACVVIPHLLPFLVSLPISQ
eukprot:scaffold25774_cov127-Cylindrotheca_fusiformis.AAC.1